ncbi:MAG: prepilin-type N-terminal cleavage/methylation domain-containing protein [Deltaproteobacteria bacterium]|nr:prepilin-type N-terminal cleavage/methylation domain-containing protein [Deltaproteobacteria bacterium]
MCNIICKNKKGITLVESLVSVVLLTIALIAVLSMQPTSLQTSAKSDYLGRGVMLLNKELMAQELLIMNPCNTISTGTVNKTAYASDQSTALDGDASFNVQTVTSAVTGRTNTWKVTVKVSWPPLNANGITENLIVTRQESFRFGCI